jgi:transcriptional regulator with XRE-family HTH domain
MTIEMAESRRDMRINVDAEIGRRIHTLMWDQRVTQTALGAELGVGQSGLGRRLRGERGWSAAELLIVSQVLQVSVAYLFGEDGDPIAPKPREKD